ncbi:MAG: hypothetical protein WDO19_16880 [Bacteroidota bacterium]
MKLFRFEHENIPQPGYLGGFKRSLKLKYQELIQQFSEPPEFLVIHPFPLSKLASGSH